MSVTQDVHRALKELTSEDVRSPAWSGYFGIKPIVVRWLKVRGGGLLTGDTALVESALLKLEQEGVVRKCENGLWRLT